MSCVMSPGPIRRMPACAHAEGGVGFHDRDRVVARRHEDEEHVGLLVLGALEERREVGHLPGAAHRDGVDHLAARGLEAGLERVQAVLARREVGVADHRGLGAQLLGRGLAHRVARVPHRERHARDHRRELRDPGRARVHHDHRLLARGGERRRGDGVGRVDEAGEDVDVVLRDQLLHRGLGRRAAGILRVALDDVDLVRRKRAGVELHVHLHAAVHLLAELGAHAREGQHDADLDRLRGCARGERGERRGGSEPRPAMLASHGHLPP